MLILYFMTMLHHFSIQLNYLEQDLVYFNSKRIFSRWDFRSLVDLAGKLSEACETKAWCFRHFYSAKKHHQPHTWMFSRTIGFFGFKLQQDSAMQPIGHFSSSTLYAKMLTRQLLLLQTSLPKIESLCD